MTDAQEALRQVREALAAGPTPGKWSCYDDSNDGKTSRIEIVAIGKTVARIYRSVPEQDLPNARLIAACSPANIAAILAHVEAQEAALVAAEAALADIGDADREPGDDLAWAERRAMQALPIVRNALACRCDMRTKLVGDGCEFCNPQLAEELAKEQR